VRQVSRRTASRRTAQRTRRSLANPTRRPSLSCGGTLHACRQPRVQTVSPSGAAHAVVVNSSTPGKLIWPGGTVSFRVRVCPVDLANGCRRTRRMRLPRMACPKPARRVLRECGRMSERDGRELVSLLHAVCHATLHARATAHAPEGEEAKRDKES